MPQHVAKRRSHQRGRAGLAMIACMAATSAISEDLRTTREMTNLSPSAADRAVRSDLLSVLRPLPGRLSTGMRVRLGDVVLSTRPYGTYFPGLCQQDELWLKYAPTDLTAKARDQPLQAFGIEARAMFHALRPLGPEEEDAKSKLRVWSEECDRVADDKEANWFEAKDATEAAEAVNLLLAAVAAIRAETLKPKNCNLFPTNHRSCTQTALDEGNIHNIEEVETCSSEDGFECYGIDVDDETRLIIVARYRADPAETVSLASVSVVQYIVVT